MVHGKRKQTSPDATRSRRAENRFNGAIETDQNVRECLSTAVLRVLILLEHNSSQLNLKM